MNFTVVLTDTEFCYIVIIRLAKSFDLRFFVTISRFNFTFVMRLVLRYVYRRYVAAIDLALCDL